jgi:glycosyltransferase involved in cell wall biosynthesis
MLTVLLATRNGARTLPSVLDAFCRLQSPLSGWKLVVVDNGSSDQTREIVISFQDRLPLTYLFEEKVGKNAALNAGLAILEGDLAVFTDDDVFPHPEWLIRLRAATDAQPSYSIFGGAILPRWEVPPPAWLEWVCKGPVFTLTDPSLTEGPTNSSNIFGPNMAIRAEVFANGIRFNSRIGPRGAEYAMGSETELVRRLVRAGHLAWHVQDAAVEHFIRDFQLKRSWVLRRAIRFGRGQYRMSQPEKPEALVLWFGVPRYLFRRLFTESLIVLKACLSLNGEALIQARWNLNYLRGQMKEARVLRSEK